MTHSYTTSGDLTARFCLLLLVSAMLLMQRHKLSGILYGGVKRLLRGRSRARLNHILLGTPL